MLILALIVVVWGYTPRNLGSFISIVFKLLKSGFDSREWWSLWSNDVVKQLIHDNNMWDQMVWLMVTSNVRLLVLVQISGWMLANNFLVSASRRPCIICNSGVAFDVRVGIHVQYDILDMLDNCFLLLLRMLRANLL